MNENRMISRMKDWGGSPMAKLLVTVFIALLLLIPVAAIKDLMWERENRRDEAVNQVIDQWGGWQYLTGPVLAVPVEEEYEEHYNDRVEKGIINHYLYILPDSLKIDASMDTQIREKGIFKIELYTGDFTLTGSFTRPANPLWDLNRSKVIWEDARLILGMGDVKGLSRDVVLDWDGSSPAFQGGTSGTKLLPEGIWAPVEINHEGSTAFTMNVSLKGGGSIRFFPMGGETEVSVNSDWISPGFTGAFIPTQRELSEEGFSAGWTIQSLARNYPQFWIDDNVTWQDINGSGFGVDFVSPVDGYFKSHRAVKYSLLFIFLPFVTLFLFEIFAAGKLHPLQYIMIGLAVVIFFLLLLTFSEHMAFNTAYLVAAAGSALLISFYTGAVLKSPVKGGLMAGLMGLLYLYLYMALASEDYALLIGSLGLFIMLAGVMIFTRKINWYEIGEK
ncbi:cell envelope integrity protein CreD [Spirochaeta isovalerica]|uniref:Inner membrane protein n=1 Tax=Spirochaeta isovalerica TaxID=150 RepID=A0A841RIB0_9SPIO|nr:cell envelope integrity protein CreD [Spirochaeta isovalerica]MBB6482268.1 inner membrane protein [Spirochaeta isovalerica]